MNTLEAFACVKLADPAVDVGAWLTLAAKFSIVGRVKFEETKNFARGLRDAKSPSSVLLTKLAVTQDNSVNGYLQTSKAKCLYANVRRDPAT